MVWHPTDLLENLIQGFQVLYILWVQNPSVQQKIQTLIYSPDSNPETELMNLDWIAEILTTGSNLESPIQDLNQIRR